MEIVEERGSIEHLLESLPREKDWVSNGNGFILYDGFWMPPKFLPRVLSFQHHYKAEPSDIFLITLPKCGTTWLKALVFSIVNRHRFSLSDSPLLRQNPHAVVRSFESDLDLQDPKSYLEGLPRPRIISTHLPYHALPPSVRTSGCKIVSIVRDPRDQFVSSWKFTDKVCHDYTTIRPIEECFDLFCRGVHNSGPFWDYFLGSWNASLERPDEVFVTRYEEMKVSPVSETKKLATFLGLPFTEEEDRERVAEEIVKLCSFDNLKGLEVNKQGRRPVGVPHEAFFRKGEVGNWTDYLTSSMADRLQKIMDDKFANSDLLTFYHPTNSNNEDCA
ncbi:cytosolic sulfotransferase 15-like [Impatiens glandulifera]|uniref:cytosolic sulfotransferase 15-like n=1 Tax=Impatiens glandulifera TaxID=253017 RepID=UPI001FB07246|nr:cytosolic sulfotransferase 15-like [Impatiens glandulifera]